MDGHSLSETFPLNTRLVLITQLKNVSVCFHRILCKNWISSKIKYNSKQMWSKYNYLNQWNTFTSLHLISLFQLPQNNPHFDNCEIFCPRKGWVINRCVFSYKSIRQITGFPQRWEIKIPWLFPDFSLTKTIFPWPVTVSSLKDLWALKVFLYVGLLLFLILANLFPPILYFKLFQIQNTITWASNCL